MSYDHLLVEVARKLGICIYLENHHLLLEHLSMLGTTTNLRVVNGLRVKGARLFWWSHLQRNQCVGGSIHKRLEM